MNRQQSDTAVLGALTFAPATGYAVRAGIRDVLGQFWSESVGQIYPTLTRLLAEGMVAASPGSRSGSSQYAITPAGRWRLGELLREPIRTAPQMCIRDRPRLAAAGHRLRPRRDDGLRLRD